MGGLNYFPIANLKSRHLIGLSVNQHNMRRFQLSDEVTCLLVVGVGREGNILDLIIATRISQAPIFRRLTVSTLGESYN